MGELVERLGWVCPGCTVYWSPEITYCGDCSPEGDDGCSDCGIDSCDESLYLKNSVWLCSACIEER